MEKNWAKGEKRFAILFQWHKNCKGNRRSFTPYKKLCEISILTSSLPHLPRRPWRCETFPSFCCRFREPFQICLRWMRRRQIKASGSAAFSRDPIWRLLRQESKSFALLREQQGVNLHQTAVGKHSATVIWMIYHSNHITVLGLCISIWHTLLFFLSVLFLPFPWREQQKGRKERGKVITSPKRTRPECVRLCSFIHCKFCTVWSRLGIDEDWEMYLKKREDHIRYNGSACERLIFQGKPLLTSL